MSASSTPTSWPLAARAAAMFTVSVDLDRKSTRLKLQSPMYLVCRLLLEKKNGGVDILLNNAGTSAAAAFMDVDDRTWQTDIELKLMADIRFCRLTILIQQKCGGGVIIN